MGGSNGNGRQGWFRIANALVDEHGAELGPYGLAVYVVLARFANADGEAWPSKATIAARAGMSKRKVDGALDDLEARGLVRPTRRRAPNGDATSNLYKLTGIRTDSSSIGSLSPGSSLGAPGALPKANDVHCLASSDALPEGENCDGSARYAPPAERPAAWCELLDAALPRIAIEHRVILETLAVVDDDGERFRITLPAYEAERLRPIVGLLEQIARRQVKIGRTVELVAA